MPPLVSGLGVFGCVSKAPLVSGLGVSQGPTASEWIEQQLTGRVEWIEQQRTGGPERVERAGGVVPTDAERVKRGHRKRGWARGESRAGGRKSGRKRCGWKEEWRR